MKYATGTALIQFPLRKDSVHADFMTKLFLVLGVGMGLILLAVWLLGDSGFEWLSLLFIIGFPSVGIWAWRRVSIGEAELSNFGIRVRSRTHTQSYPWEDIAKVHIVTVSEANSGVNTAFLRALVIDMSRDVVLLELRRRARHHFLFNRIGTRIVGVPYHKRIWIEPADVERFAETANQFLATNGRGTDSGESRSA